MDPASETSAGVAFGRFLVLPHRRELLADSQPIKLGGRAFDVLMALIEARGAVLSKDALITRVWPDRIVEENALQGQISGLRMALGADRDLVRTVFGRGAFRPSCGPGLAPARRWVRHAGTARSAPRAEKVKHTRSR